MDAAQQRALGVLTSSRLLDALDISREPASVANATATVSPTSSSTTAPDGQRSVPDGPPPG